MSHETYENDLVPGVQATLEFLLSDNADSKIRLQMLPYVVDLALKSLSALDWMRREGKFPNKEFPVTIGFALDNFSAALVTASGCEDSEEIAEFYRNRRGKTGLEKVVN